MVFGEGGVVALRVDVGGVNEGGVDAGEVEEGSLRVDAGREESVVDAWEVGRGELEDLGGG